MGFTLYLSSSAKVCEDPNDTTKYLDGCSNTDHTLLRSGTLVCFMKEFQTWHRQAYNDALPTKAAGVTKDQFYERLKTFRNDPSNKPAALGAYVIYIHERRGYPTLCTLLFMVSSLYGNVHMYIMMVGASLIPSILLFFYSQVRFVEELHRIH